ncbi:GNAT family protein [Brooklawnia cerclae]|uniref:Ribosomal-protein-alanine N-acetyltransferase n=1 Tax=Brooklawnia cerclae TaxID=349934 RepID=A0ABX0SJ27_9ACTN|nr:ribosomal-protein-alanine N-acetyltransferase [Brooklawnia cerclae]
MVLRAGALVLRPIGKHEAIIWDALRASNYFWTREWDATMPPATTTRPLPFDRWLRQTNQQGRAGTLIPWGMAIDPDWPSDPRPPDRTRLMGQLTVANIVLGSARSATIGYWIDRHYAGRGLTPVAVALACDYLWQVLRLHRVEIAIRPENRPSLRVVEKLGFREEGLRPAFLHIDGDWRDHRIFALNAEEVPGGLLDRYLDGRPLPVIGRSGGTPFGTGGEFAAG